MIGIIMGSASDYEVMREACNTLTFLRVPHETIVLSAHRTPEETYEYAKTAKGKFRAIIAGAGGAAALPGVIAGLTDVPVLGVPMQTVLGGLDSLLSIVQMPGGVPVATFGIGKAGAINAAVFAARMLAHDNPDIEKALGVYKRGLAEKVLKSTLEGLA